MRERPWPRLRPKPRNTPSVCAQARAEAYKLREQRTKQWNTERDAALDAARQAAGQKVRQAQAELDAEAACRAGQLFKPRPPISPARPSAPFCQPLPGVPVETFWFKTEFLRARFLAWCCCWPVAALMVAPQVAARRSKRASARRARERGERIWIGTAGSGKIR